MTFIDTGAFLARYLQRDQFHDRALKAWQELENAVSEDCFTSNFVLDETFTLLGRHADYRFAADRARHILASQTLRILRPDSDDEFLAIELFEKYADQRVSFTDCVSFVPDQSISSGPRLQLRSSLRACGIQDLADGRVALSNRILGLS